MRDATAVNRLVSEAKVAIVAAGPFQGMPTTVLEAALRHGVHYIDLTDDRDYYCRVRDHQAAIESRGITALSALSTLCGISAVLAQWGATQVGGAESIHVAISPGNQNPRGAGTISSVLSSVGQPIKIWHNNTWETRLGWTGAEEIRFPAPVGSRQVFWMDGPDYEVLPRELSCQNVIFKAGLELNIMNKTLAILAKLRQKWPALLLERYTHLLIRLSLFLAPFGTSRGGLRVAVQNKDRRCEAFVLAEKDGPLVAATPAAVATARLLNGEIQQRGFISLNQWISVASLIEELEKRRLEVIT